MFVQGLSFSFWYARFRNPLNALKKRQKVASVFCLPALKAMGEITRVWVPLRLPLLKNKCYAFFYSSDW